MERKRKCCVSWKHFKWIRQQMSLPINVDIANLAALLECELDLNSTVHKETPFRTKKLTSRDHKFTFYLDANWCWQVDPTVHVYESARRTSMAFPCQVVPRNDEWRLFLHLRALRSQYVRLRSIFPHEANERLRIDVVHAPSSRSLSIKASFELVSSSMRGNYSVDRCQSMKLSWHCLS